jgi:HEXXH motif-containing protein
VANLPSPSAPLEPPRDLTIPEAGSTTAHRVLSRALGKLVTDLGGIGRARALAGGPAAPTAAELSRIAARALKKNPGALVSAIRSPTVGALIRCLRPGGASRATDSVRGQRSEELLEELTALLALELARTNALPAPVRLRRAPSRLLSLAGRLAVAVRPDRSALLIQNGWLLIERRGGAAPEALDLGALTGSGPYREIDRGIALALADNNPLSMVEAHPDKEGNAVDLGDKPAEAWVAALRSALALIERHMPDLRREMDLYIHQIVPVGWNAEQHLSASYQEAIGTIYMSLHPSLMTMTEALIHEFSHNKLNALFELDEVLENAWRPLYTSPVRPDPRPLHGVLLAVHAFLPVARLYELMIESGDPEAKSAAFHERFARIRQMNRDGASVVLTNGRPTAVGAGLLDEIRRWDAHFSDWEARSS